MPSTPVILLLEDHTELGEVICDVMTEEGYDVLTVRDQFAAVATLRNQSVDLVIADLSTPEAGQPDPLAEIVRDFSDIPRIAIVDGAHGTLPFFGPWRISEGHGTLRRPFKLDDLLTVTREMVG